MLYWDLSKQRTACVNVLRASGLRTSVIGFHHSMDTQVQTVNPSRGHRSRRHDLKRETGTAAHYTVVTFCSGVMPRTEAKTRTSHGQLQRLRS